MDSLPVEVFVQIIQLLPNSQLRACKEVCRAWYLMVSNEVKIKKLILSNTSHFNLRWYGSYEFASSNDLIKITDLNKLNLNQPNFERLKALFLYSDHFPIDRKFSIGRLVNHLERLEQLEMLGLANDAESDCIALKSLRTLHLSACYWNDLVVDCPNLSDLKMFCSFSYDPEYSVHNQKIHFKHPESVRSLEVERLRSEWVENFKNLEELSLNWIYTIRGSFLSGKPRLLALILLGLKADLIL